MAKITRAELEKENTRLEARLDLHGKRDAHLREVFSDLFENVEYVGDRFYGGNKPEKKVVVATWEEIFFMMGELKADADYSTTLSNNQKLRSELDHTYRTIEDLKNPEGKKLGNV